MQEWGRVGGKTSTRIAMRVGREEELRRRVGCNLVKKLGRFSIGGSKLGELRARLQVEKTSTNCRKGRARADQRVLPCVARREVKCARKKVPAG